jgi:hypothetical protein
MRIRTDASLATIFVVLLTIGACSLALSPPASVHLWARAPDSQSLTGKILSIRDAEFSVEIGKNKKAQPVVFLIDENTRIDGKLAIGAPVTVEYQVDKGNNFAVHVVVTSPAAKAPSSKA